MMAAAANLNFCTNSNISLLPIDVDK